ncbi:NAD-dependent epimerase/dehydratase family protein [Plantactinospora sp. KBS50]|uniref:NAD-dependent epimerase/dehydratase family protein n=1 Tax=Plantactinospora sp. KBS50 TaxID=2024580 RepID=UPI0012FDA4AC|nr:NAD-dependent epimerase/dehydratase family protein [Plantactinospora sp. KBS50]
MRIAITGATGNIGTALLRRLGTAEPDIEVLGIARRLPEAGTAPYDRARWQSVDLGDPSAVGTLTESFAGLDAVVHLAWQVQPSHRRARLRRTNLAGTRHLLRAVTEAQVPKLVYASSIAAYAPGPKDNRVDENWPTTGVSGSGFSADKAAVEAMLDGLEWENPALQVIRLRTPPVLQYLAGAELTRYFFGGLIPVSLLRSGRLPLVPANRHLRGQVVHADDAAEAYLRAVRSDRRGAYNIAAEPVLDAAQVADEVGGRVVHAPLPVLRMLAKLAWRAKLIPTEPGWLDLTAAAPLVDCTRAERELGWRPSRNGRETIRELLHGVVEGAGTASPALRPNSRYARSSRGAAA